MSRRRDPEDLARELASAISRGLGVRSAWALQHGLESTEEGGVPGILVIHFPGPRTAMLDVTWAEGAAGERMSSTWTV